MTGADIDSARSAHICLFYSNDEEYWTPILAFITEGLEYNDLVLFIADIPRQEELIARLNVKAAMVISALKSGRLMLRTPEETYLRKGDFDPEQGINDILKFSKKAVDQGYRAFRLTGNADFTCREIPGSNRLMEFENAINKYFDSIRCHALCQYNLTQLPHGLLLEAIYNHPYVVLGGVTRKNPYYHATDRSYLSQAPISTHLSRIHDVSEGCDGNGIHNRSVPSDVSPHETLLSRALQAIPGRISIQSPDFRVVYSNWRFENQFSPEERSSRPYCFRIFMGRDKPCDPCPLKVTLGSGKPASCFHVLPGEEKITEVMTFPVTDHSGGITHVLEHAVLKDQAGSPGEGPERSVQTYEQALMVSNSGIFRLRSSEKTLSGDPAASCLLGYQAPGKTSSWKDLSTMVHPEDWDIIHDAIEDIPGTGRGFVCHVRVRAASGQWHELELRGGAADEYPPDGPGIITGIITDIGLVNPEMSAIHEAQRKIYLLTTATRHDIANIVTALVAYLNLAEEIVTDEEAGEFLKKGEVLALAVRDQLQFMKDYQELGVRGPAWLDIRDVIMTAAASLEHTRVTFSFSLQPGLIFADPMIRKVFANIFDNAYRHGGHISRISVRGQAYVAG